MKQYHTTDSIAKILGISTTVARRRIAGGEWKPSAETTSGVALFSEDAAVQIVTREQSRKDRRRRASPSKRAGSVASPAYTREQSEELH